MRLLLRTCFALAAPVIIGSCSTGAQIEAQRQNDILASLVTELDSCYRRIDSNPAYLSIRGKIVSKFDGSEPLAALTDTEKPTKEQVSLLYAMHADTQECRKLQLDAATKAHPLRLIVFVEQFSEADEVWTGIVAGKLTWGEFNSRRKKATEAAKARMIQADAQINADLQTRHVDEVAQRQRAAAAFQQWAYQQQQLQAHQQVVNALNRPRTINCSYYGNGAQCTSF